ncbi:hypothetical protein [Archaeoglobus veneficus]|uniref:Uncharacterized protein n=1 Tax=Archaeoglobus veneficus (strain DSM 11195 / SNP6) TaxID=693661 RepID=F2KNV5_ARCVS|nr:hypothetical protein [Archaeoglobus veneficus]AEA47432.1 hypothetical protein Arcve_1429 [Archaeoglobus veneficus SNP6]
MKKVLLAAMLVAIASLVLPATALTANSVDEGGVVEDIGVNAYVDPEGSPPIIKAKWEIYDEDQVKPGTQVNINPADDPGPKKLWSIVVVTDPNGAADIANVYMDLYHPCCGEFKYQRHAWEITPPLGEGNVPDMTAPIFDGYTLEELLDMALASGYINQTQYDDILMEVSKKDARVFIVELEIHHHQPYGWYIAEAWATDTGGAISEKYCNYFEVLPMLAYSMDFDTVSFGDIKPCIEKIVYGDKDLGTPDLPTLKNDGNTMIALAAHDTMGATSVNTNQPKTFINVFDLRFLDEQVMLNTSEWYYFHGLLAPCNYTQVDFSIHLPMGAPAGAYTGVIELEIIPVVEEYCVPVGLAGPCGDGICQGS